MEVKYKSPVHTYQDQLKGLI